MDNRMGYGNMIVMDSPIRYNGMRFNIVVLIELYRKYGSIW